MAKPRARGTVGGAGETARRTHLRSRPGRLETICIVGRPGNRGSRRQPFEWFVRILKI